AARAKEEDGAPAIPPRGRREIALSTGGCAAQTPAREERRRFPTGSREPPWSLPALGSFPQSKPSGRFASRSAVHPHLPARRTGRSEPRRCCRVVTCVAHRRRSSRGHSEEVEN